MCYWCGNHVIHPRKDCPALKSKRHKCGKSGHLATIFKSKSCVLRHISNPTTAPKQLGEDFYFTGYVTSSGKCAPWQVLLRVGCEEVNSCDTVADVSVIPEHLLSKLQNQAGLQQPKKILLGPTKDCLHVLIMLQAPVTFKDAYVMGEFYVCHKTCQRATSWLGPHRCS